MKTLKIGKLTLSIEWGDKWQALAREGEFIAAIKMYRETRGYPGLKESKEAVEAYLAKIGKPRDTYQVGRY